MIDFGTFTRADPIRRGCGDERVRGGMYLECGRSKDGVPPEELMLCPAWPIPPGLDLVNKPQVLPRILDHETGQAAIDPATGLVIHDVYIWVGEMYYPDLRTYVEEVRLGGISRHVSENLPVELLSRESLLYLAHPKARITNWAQLSLPRRCWKHPPSHDPMELARSGRFDPFALEKVKGPCVFKTWDVMEPQEGDRVIQPPGCEAAHWRQIGKTGQWFQFFPTGERVEAWEPGFFMRVRPTCISLVKYGDGAVNERARTRLMQATRDHGVQQCLPFYEADQ
jgi:hypothetical protein